MTHFAPPASRGLAATLTAAFGLGWVSLSAAATPTDVFAGDGLRVEVESAGPDGRTLEGGFVLGDERYPFRATTEPDFSLSHGTFEANGGTFTFTLTPVGPDALRLVTDDTPYRLQRLAVTATPATEPATSPATPPATPPAADPKVAGHREPAANPQVPSATAAAAPFGLELRAVSPGVWEVVSVDPNSRAQAEGYAAGHRLTGARDAAGQVVSLRDPAAVAAALTQDGTRILVERPGQAAVAPAKATTASAADHVASTPAKPAADAHAAADPVASAPAQQTTDAHGAATPPPAATDPVASAPTQHDR